MSLWTLELCAVFFNEGADVDATNTNTMTPFYHALLQRFSFLELGCYFIISRIDIGEGKSYFGSGEIFETAKVLVEFEANHNLESRPRFVGEKFISARELGANHLYDRVKVFFFDCAGDFFYNIFKNKFYFLQIGRTWMLPSLSEMSGTEHDGFNLIKYINIERFFNNYDGGRTSDEDKRQSKNLDFSFFLIFDNIHQSHISNSKTHVSDGLWSFAKIDGFIAGFDESNTSPNTEQSAQVNLFSHFNSYIFKTPLEAEAGELWADFGKSKGYFVLRVMCINHLHQLAESHSFFGHAQFEDIWKRIHLKAIYT